MACQFSEQLVEFQMDLLEGPEADALADHLFKSDCPDCQTELRKIGPVVLGLQGLRERYRKEKTPLPDQSPQEE
jgi:hypothetical protein